jgi:VanZ like protein
MIRWLHDARLFTGRRCVDQRGPRFDCVKASSGYLIAASLYLGVLLPWLVMDVGVRQHPRAYLLEFQFASPARLAGDAIANVVAFVPLGWLLSRGIRDIASSATARGLIVAGFGAGVSLAVETLQLFLPSRYSSMIDVVTNTTGMVLGAIIAGRWRGGAR